MTAPARPTPQPAGWTMPRLGASDQARPSGPAAPAPAHTPAPAPAPGGVDRLVATMSRLRAPGGCPWDAQQSHRSLVLHLLEEAYEAAEAIELADRAALREELGDVLLQVVFHASIAAEHPSDPFDLEDLANGVADKLIRRHPDVFAAQPAPDLTAEESYRRWDQIKTAEKSRASALDGIPAAQSALARAQKVFGRARRAGLEPQLGAGEGLGARLAALAKEADAAGLDAEQELRAATRRVEAQVRALESVEKVKTGAHRPGPAPIAAPASNEREAEC